MRCFLFLVFTLYSTLKFPFYTTRTIIVTNDFSKKKCSDVIFISLLDFSLAFWRDQFVFVLSWKHFTLTFIGFSLKSVFLTTIFFLPFPFNLIFAVNILLFTFTFLLEPPICLLSFSFPLNPTIYFTVTGKIEDICFVFYFNFILINLLLKKKSHAFYSHLHLNCKLNFFLCYSRTLSSVCINSIHLFHQLIYADKHVQLI